MKSLTQLATLAIVLSIQAQQINNIDNHANSALTKLNINFPTDQVQNTLTFVESQINPNQPTGSPTTITVFDSDSDDIPTHNAGNDSVSPTESSDSSSPTLTNGSSNTTTSNTSSGSQILSPIKYAYIANGVMFALIGNCLL